MLGASISEELRARQWSSKNTFCVILLKYKVLDLKEYETISIEN
mgnify:CR=1 FL=1